MAKSSVPTPSRFTTALDISHGQVYSPDLQIRVLHYLIEAEIPLIQVFDVAQYLEMARDRDRTNSQSWPSADRGRWDGNVSARFDPRSR